MKTIGYIGSRGSIEDQMPVDHKLKATAAAIAAKEVKEGGMERKRSVYWGGSPYGRTEES